jgi:putative FmdB family regulatory protein
VDVPIYEYTCGSCKTKFEHLARTMSGKAKVKCPECGSPDTARSLSVFAVSSAAPKGGGASADVPTCGRCGGPPGSCAMG